jgi:lipopolysaccharide transport system permease protein
VALSDIVTVIEPPERWPKLRLRALWSRRDLAYFLAWRDVRLRYKQSLLGVAWVVLQPLAMVATFTLVFDNITNVPTQGFPYPIFVLAGLIPWNYFAQSVGAGSSSLVSNMPLVTKVYFHRMVLPISSILTWSIDFLVSFALLLVMMAIYGIMPPLTILLVPLIGIFIVIVSLAVSLLLAAFNVQFRDVRYILPFLIQMWFFLTPVIYPSESIESGESWLRVIYALNPMVAIVESFRWAALGAPAPSLTLLIPSAVFTIVLLFVGSVYFMRTEQNFADVI